MKKTTTGKAASKRRGKKAGSICRNGQWLKKAKPEPYRYYVNAEALPAARAIVAIRRSTLTERELVVILGIALCRSPGSAAGDVDDDFEELRISLCAPWAPWMTTTRQLPGPNTTLEWWFKLFLREPDTVLAVMRAAVDIDKRNSRDPLMRKLRNEVPGENTFGRSQRGVLRKEALRCEGRVYST